MPEPFDTIVSIDVLLVLHPGYYCTYCVCFWFATTKYPISKKNFFFYFFFVGKNSIAFCVFSLRKFVTTTLSLFQSLFLVHFSSIHTYLKRKYCTASELTMFYNGYEIFLYYDISQPKML